MKQFLKYVLATVVGIIIVSVLFTFLTITTLIGMAGMQSANTVVNDNSVLVIKMEGSLSERSEDNPLSMILGNSLAEEQSLANILKAIDQAKENDKIKGIYIEAGSFTGAAPAMLQEIRNALTDFKKTNKFIVSYGDIYTQGTYYLSTVADSVIINPQGMIDWHGMALQTMYYKDLLDKVGVKMQVFKVGTYKSAVEPFLLNDMSEANREQLDVLAQEIWSGMVAEVSKSRNISVEKLNLLADSCMAFAMPTDYKKTKLVDKLAYSDEVPQIICNMMEGVDSPDDYHTVTANDLASITNNKPKGTSGNIIAVYYAYGDIVQEASTGFGGLSGEHEIVGKDVIKDLKELADNDDVKAVVLRVNSGGGSAYASEQIWHQIMNIKKKKPVIVSMGGYAASGGYYISCAADWIVAEPTTLTGSIGIFGMFPEASELMNKKLGLHVATVKTNEHADLGLSMARPFNESESALIQRYINSGYELFTKRCADGRKMKQADIKAIAEGRVWTGMHAKQIGLVDQLGNLKDAIAVAEKKAKVKEYSVMEYPSNSSILENLMKEVSGNSYADAQMKAALGEYQEMFGQLKNINRKTGIQASLPYYLRFNL